ncbi:MAG: hypothetical protein DMD87_12150 [Candidatus Rokuibacteriota bacterium]|nr:MAG: hypothetical protein DMD87_12150 [Candidatus Rokubacteria bacterium]
MRSSLSRVSRSGWLMPVRTPRRSAHAPARRARRRSEPGRSDRPP